MAASRTVPCPAPPMPDAPTVIFDVDRGLLETLEAQLGPPIDSYLMGWQVWLHPVEGTEVELELRLHPPAGFEQPEGLDHHLLWEEVVRQVADGAEVLELGRESRRLEEVFVLLEVYPVFAPASVEQTRAWAEQLVGRRALGAGRVDHDLLAGRFRREQHDADLPGALRSELADG